MNGIDGGALFAGVQALIANWQSLLMMSIGGLLIYLAIAKEYEPVLLLPIGIGAVIGNLPLSAMVDPAAHGMLALIKKADRKIVV